MKPLSMNMEVGSANATYGKISEIYLFSILIVLKAIKSGISVEWIGIMTPIRNMPRTNPEYFHLNLFREKAAIADTIIVIATDEKETSTELKKLVPILPAVHAVR